MGRIVVRHYHYFLSPLSLLLLSSSNIIDIKATTTAFAFAPPSRSRTINSSYNNRHYIRCQQKQHSTAANCKSVLQYSSSCRSRSSSLATATSDILDDSSSGSDSSIMWDPISQTYKGGTVPSHHTSMDIHDLLASNTDGKLKIFGYGSLCWHPGSDGVLSLASIEEDEHDHDLPTNKPRRRRQVTTAPGRAIGYQRCWSQRSADHRGSTQFNGIVCTLLSDEEVWRLHTITEKLRPPPSMTEGLIYTIDEELVYDCLAELDFREKGGYARDVIDVVEDDTGKTVKALLYRGTPDNPAFWKRVLVDLPLAAAIISVAIGPSGPNDIYLLHLHAFLAHAAQHSSAAKHALEDHSGDVHTRELATMVTLLQSTYRPYFLFGAGSNEHDQLLLNPHSGCETTSSDNGVIDVDEVDELTEMLLVAPRQSTNHHDDENDTASNEEQCTTTRNADHDPKSLHAGGGHSALLTHGGDLYLWGWNDAGQLGRRDPTTLSSKSIQGSSKMTPSDAALNPVQPLSNIKVDTVDLGHTHTLVIEKNTGRLYGFGENGRGQVSGCANNSNDITNDDSNNNHVPRTPIGLSEESFVDVAAGLFHSAAISERGELVTWGCGRFGQCLRPSSDANSHDAASTVGRWRPADGSKLVQVACGRRHTVALDEYGRIWTLGNNKYGQLGRSIVVEDHNNTVISQQTYAEEPQLVDGPLGQVNSGCFAICSGWSHILALTRDNNGSDEAVTMYGWGRNDKGQLGMTSAQKISYVLLPQVLNPLVDSNRNPSDGGAMSIQSACCGAESSHVLDKSGNIIYSTGWNEHGNLAIGRNKDDEKDSDQCCSSWTATSGVSVVAPPPNSKAEKKLFASGGAHLIVMAI